MSSIPDVSKVNYNGVLYNVKDAVTRGKMDEVDAARQQAIQDIQAEGQTQTGAVTAEGTAQKNAVTEEGIRVLGTIPSDYTALAGDVGDLKSAVEVLEPTATSGDVGKALVAKTVENGKVTEYEYGAGSEEGALYYSETQTVLNPWGNGGVTLSEDGKTLTVKTIISGGQSVYFFRQNNGAIGTNYPIDADCYDADGNKLAQKIYAWSNPVTVPVNTAYIIQSLSRNSAASGVNKFNNLPFVITSNADETTVYGIAETETTKNGTSEINNAVTNSVDIPKSVYDTIENYFDAEENTVSFEVYPGDVIRSNLFSIKIVGWLSESEDWNGSELMAGTNLNNAVTGEPPTEASFTVPHYYHHVTITYNPTYPNLNQSQWLPIENPYISVNVTTAPEDFPAGTNVILENNVEGKIVDIVDEAVDDALVAAGVESVLHGKKWMVFGDSTSIYAGEQYSYPAYVADRTGCIVTNKAMAGSRIADIGDGTPIVDIVTANLTSDMQVLTLVGGYNDRRSYDASNPDWTWLGTMFSSGTTLNMDKTTFYGALNTIASTWFSVCPAATKAWFSIFPCGTDPNGVFETRINGIIKEVAMYWNIPFFDAWSEVGLPVRLDYINQTYYMGDRIHPNAVGGEFISHYIQPKLESIMA